jgi:hypothetical protein
VKNSTVYLILAGVNIAGMLVSVFYGKYGGSGGETTEGFFLGIKLTGIVSLICMSYMLVKFGKANVFLVTFSVIYVVWSLLQIFFLSFFR